MKTVKWLCVMVSMLGMTGLLQAQSYTNILSGNWLDSTSWKGGRIPPGGSTNQIYFDGAGAMVSTNNLGALVVNRFQVVAAKNVTLSGNDLVFTNTVAGVLPMISKDVSMVFVVSNSITAKTNMTFYANNTGGSIQLFGTLTSSNLLTKSGNGVLSVETNNATWNGGLSIINGTMQTSLSGSSSDTPFGTGNISLYGWGVAAISQPMLSITPARSGTTSLAGGTDVGSQLSFEGVTFLNVTTNGPASPVAFTYGPGSGAQVLNRVNRGVLVLSDQNSDDGNNPNQVIKAMGTSGGNNFIINGAVPEVNNGMVEPYMLGARSGGQVKGVFMTYDPTYGFKAISAYDKDDTFTGATSSHKVLIRSALTLSSDLSIYALTLVNNFTLNSVLTIGDGTRAAGLILNGPAAALSIAGSGSLNFGNSEGIIYCNNYNNIIGIPISGNNGITKAQGKNSAGTLILTNDSPNLLGTSVLAGGTLQLGNGATSGSIGGNLKMHPQTTLVYNRIDTNAPIGGVLTPNGAYITVTAGAMTLNSNNLLAGSMNTFAQLNIANSAGLAINGSVTSTNSFASMNNWERSLKLFVGGGVNTIGGNTWMGGNAAIYATGGVLNLNGFIMPYNPGYNYLQANGGTLNLGNAAAIARNGIGVVDILNGGSTTFLAGGGGVGFNLGSGQTGIVYQVGGSFSGTGYFNLGSATASYGEYTMTGGTFTDPSLVQFGIGRGIINLNGGVFTVNKVTYTGTAVSSTLRNFNFNGGTLKANVADNAFFNTSLIKATIFANGATIDDNGFSFTFAQSLLAPDGQGVTSLPWGGTLTGYIGAPYVGISGGGGTGATAVALFNFASGSVTGIVITCSGTGYTSAPAVTLVGGGASTVELGSATIGDIASGGLTKIGSGTLTLSGTNTFTGATLISAGMLSLSHTNVLPATAIVYITSTSGAKVSLSTGTHIIRKLYVDNVLQPKTLLNATKLSVISGAGSFYPTQGRTGTLMTFF